jgi:protein-S-isoprenylcysteine O-methyltransferase Ste14
MIMKTPSPKVRQTVMAIILVLLGLFLIETSYEYNLLVHPSLLLDAFGGAFLLLGLVIRILAFKEIRNTYRIENLVTSGIYSKIRNPVYLSFIFIIVAVSLFSRCLLAFAWSFVSVLVLYWVAKKEESDLEKAFGGQYVSYKKKVPMFLPRLKFHKTRQ